MNKLTRKKPYIIKALYDWFLDNELNPCIAVFSEYPRTLVPNFVKKEGLILLNISPDYVLDLNIGQEITTIKAIVDKKEELFEFYTESIAFIRSYEDESIIFEFDIINYEDYINEYKIKEKRPTFLKLLKK